MKERYGIDLGTTYSCVSYVDVNGEVIIVPNRENENTTPSVVQYRNNTFLVGQVAKNNAVRYPSDTIETVKRHMGKPDYYVKAGGKKFKPEEISAEILRKLVDDANSALRKNINEVVITVPAYFGQAERDATAKAAKIAGLKLYKIIDEPTASAVSYQYQNEDRRRDEHVLVYDLGGGTFDISLVHLYSNGAIKVERHDGKKVLGGKDWDMIILNYILEQYADNNGYDVNSLLMDSDLIQALTSEVENAKKRLSERREVEIAVGDDYISLTREKFDELTSIKLENTIAIIDEMFAEMQSFGGTIPKISKVLMVGGSTYMPQVKARLQERFPNCEIERYKPDEAVARGAAIYAADKAQITINAFKSYGTVVIMHDKDRNYDLPIMKDPACCVDNLILIHDSLPQSVTHTYSTVVDNQRSVKVDVIENTYPEKELMLKQYRKYAANVIGSCVMELTPGKPKGYPLNITFEMIDATGLIVTCVEKDNPNKKVVLPVRIGNAG